MTSEYGLLDHFYAGLQIVGLPADQLYTSSVDVGQFGERGILCESMELRNTTIALWSNQTELGKLPPQ